MSDFYNSISIQKSAEGYIVVRLSLLLLLLLAYTVGPVKAASTDTLVLYMAEDSLNGNATFNVSVNGVSVATNQAVTTLNSSNGTQAFTYTGTFGANPTIAVSFTNQYSANSQSRNLYWYGISYDGKGYNFANAIFTYDHTVTYQVPVQKIAGAQQFISSIGTNIHLSFLNTSYNSGTIPTMVERSLDYLGINLVRDAPPPFSSIIPTYQALVNYGVHFDFLMPSGAVNIASDLAQIDPFGSSVVAVEGPNEITASSITFNGVTGYPAALASQQALYQAVKADVNLPNASVYNFSLGTSDYSAFGNMSASADYGNAHVYFQWPGQAGPYAPDQTIPQVLGDIQPITSAKPLVITETNYYTETAAGQDGVGNDVQAKYDLDLLMDAASQGVAAVYFYELLDEQSDPTNSNIQEHFGLFNVDGTPKPVATAIHNLTTILSDPGESPSFLPNTLNYTSTKMPANSSEFVFEKQDGTYIIAMWEEPQLWNSTTETENTAPSSNINITFPQTYQSINVYDPMISANPIDNYVNQSTVQVQISDHPIFIEISPNPATSTVSVEQPVNVTVGTTTVGIVSPNAIGFSYGKSEISKSYCVLCAASAGSGPSREIALISDLGSAGTIRVGADQLPYVPSSYQTEGQVGDGDIQNFANFMNALPAGWKVIYNLDYVSGTPAMAAAEATKAASLLGTRLAAFEIGNELEANPNYPSSTPAEFAASWRIFALAVKAAVPSANFVGPITGTASAFSQYAATFMATNSDLVSFVTTHYYDVSPTYYSIGMLMLDDFNLPAYLGNVKTISSSCPNGYTCPASYSNLPISIDETNEQSDGGRAGIANTYGSAIWAIDMLFKASELAYGAGPITFNFTSCGGYGGCYTQGYSPIIDTSTIVYPNPEYAGIRMFSMAGSGKMVDTTVSGASNMNVYSIVNGSTMTVTLINRDSSENDDVTITAPGTIGSGSYITMTAPNISDTVPGDIKIQGASISSNGAFASTPAAATIISIPSNTTSNTGTVSVPAHSVVIATINLENQPQAPTIPSTYFGLTTLHYGIDSPTIPSGLIRSWDGAGLNSKGIDWADSNTFPGVYNFKDLDQFIAFAQTHNSQMIYTLGRTPRWASSQPNSILSPYGTGQCAPPSNLANWDNYVRAIVIHAAGRIKYWELWNEAQDPQFYCGSIPTLVLMAQHAYTIIKSLDPTAVVLSPSVVGSGSLPWLTKYMQAGGSRYADIIAFHAYSGQTAESIVPVVQAYKSFMQTNGLANKPLWDTESSWGNGSTPTLTAAQEAGFVAKYYLLHWSLGVSNFTWYAFDAGVGWGQLWNSSTGLSPAGTAYAQTYNWMVGATMISPCSEDDNSIWACTLTKPNGYQAQAIWNSNSSMSVTVPSIYTQYRDLTGAVYPITNNTVTIGDQPILLEN